MYASIITWTFKPGTDPQRVRDGAKALETTMRQVVGLRSYYLARTGDDTYASILLYDTREHAEAGLATLTPAARQQLGEIIANMERQSGEVEAQLDFGASPGPPPGSLGSQGAGR